MIGDANREGSPYASILSKHRPDLSSYEALYKRIHANPELSGQESETAETITEYLSKLSSDFDIRTKIGGHGLIAILKNNAVPGETKTVLMRADMDALPVSEDTGFEHASKKTMKDADGQTKPVMHACGHDLHVTTALAAAETLLAAREFWKGTAIFLFQPGEERAQGAKAMVDDGLYDHEKHNCPKPDVVLAQHVLPMKSGNVGIRFGSPMSAADSFEVTIYGRGGHASMPHLTCDPLVLACHIVVRWQTIISREVPPSEIAVITVGSIQSGATEDVISSKAVLKINIRTVSTEWRKKILESIKRVTELECEIQQCPKPPKFEQTSHFPLTVNDETVTKTISNNFTTYFGDAYDPNMGNALASEDCSTLATSIDKPCCYWFYGGIAADIFEQHKKNDTISQIPGNHSAQFAPCIQPTLTTGVDAMTIAALSMFNSE